MYGNGCADDENSKEGSTAKDDAAEAGTDNLQAQMFSEGELSYGGKQQSSANSRNFKMASTSNQEFDSGSEVSSSTRSLRTRAVLADRMSDEESIPGSGSETASGTACTSDKEDEVEDGTQNQKSPDGANL